MQERRAVAGSRTKRSRTVVSANRRASPSSLRMGRDSSPVSSSNSPRPLQPATRPTTTARRMVDTRHRFLPRRLRTSGTFSRASSGKRALSSPAVRRRNLRDSDMGILLLLAAGSPMRHAGSRPGVSGVPRVASTRKHGAQSGAYGITHPLCAPGHFSSALSEAPASEAFNSTRFAPSTNLKKCT